MRQPQERLCPGHCSDTGAWVRVPFSVVVECRAMAAGDNLTELYVPSYWLLGDDQLELSKNGSHQKIFEANFKHSLLFNPSLLFSDSMAINNRNFRYLLEHSQEFRTLIQETNFTVAVRVDNDDKPSNIVELKRTFSQSGKSRVTELDNSEEGLSFLQKTAHQIPYSIKSVSQEFSERAVEVFLDDSVQEQLPNNIWRDVHDLAKEAREEQPADFGLDFFFYRLKDRLLQRRKGRDSNFESSIDRYMEAIKDIAQYPYITALPNSIDTMPIYASKHAAAFTICGKRGRMHSPEGPHSVSIPLLTGLAAFETLIGLLPAEDIIDLRSSSEASGYFKARFEFDVNRLEGSKTDFHIALGRYVRLIEDRIIRRFDATRGTGESISVNFDIKERHKVGLIKGLDYLPDAYAYISLGMSVAHPEVGIPAFLGLLFVVPAVKLVKKMAATAVISNISSADVTADLEAVRALKVNELQTGRSESEKIPSSIIVTKTRGRYIPDETIYTNDRLT